jgi:hypothetical protein
MHQIDSKRKKKFKHQEDPRERVSGVSRLSSAFKEIGPCLSAFGALPRFV